MTKKIPTATFCITGALEKYKRIDAIVISTQHDDFDDEERMLARIREDLKTKLMPLSTKF